MKLYVFLLVIPLLLCSCSNERSDKRSASSVVVNSSQTDSVDSSFQFLGEAINRDENFDDTDHVVTVDNVMQLYRSYDVTSLGDGYYLVESKKAYTNSRYLSRLLKFNDGVQIAAKTFYDYSLCDFCKMDEKLIVGLNSLQWSNPNYPSSFKCKVVAMSKELVPIKEKTLSYDDGEYTYIDTMYITTENKIYVEAVSIMCFDCDYDYHYHVTFDNNLNKISESKKVEKTK